MDTSIPYLWPAAPRIGRGQSLQGPQRVVNEFIILNNTHISLIITSHAAFFFLALWQCALWLRINTTSKIGAGFSRGFRLYIHRKRCAVINSNSNRILGYRSRDSHTAGSEERGTLTGRTRPLCSKEQIGENFNPYNHVTFISSKYSKITVSAAALPKRLRRSSLRELIALTKGLYSCI